MPCLPEPPEWTKWTNGQMTPCGDPFSKMPSDLAFPLLQKWIWGAHAGPSESSLQKLWRFFFRVRTQHFLSSNKISLGSPRFQDSVDPGMSLHSPFLFQIHMHRWTSLLADTEYAIRPKWLLFHPRFYTQNTLCFQMKLSLLKTFCIRLTKFNRSFVWKKFSVVL